MKLLRSLIQDAGFILLPSDCAGCGLENQQICEECLGSVAISAAASGRLGRRLPSGQPIVSAFEYSERASALLVAFKQRGTRRLARAFRPALEHAISRALESAESLGTAGLLGTAVLLGRAEPRIELVPVPSTAASDRKRGFNPVRTMLRVAGLRYSRVLSSSMRESQKQLGVQDRFENLRNSMRAVLDLEGRTFLLVDDIVTTGASLSEAARAIESAGGRVAACATLASTLKKKPQDLNFA